MTESIDILFLKTSLFGAESETLKAVNSITGLATKLVDLQPGQMGDADWDAVLEQVLRAGKVVTL